MGQSARIPTEINRLTQLIPPLTVKSQPEFSTGNRHSLRVFIPDWAACCACPLFLLYLTCSALKVTHRNQRFEASISTQTRTAQLSQYPVQFQLSLGQQRQLSKVPSPLRFLDLRPHIP